MAATLAGPATRPRRLPTLLIRPRRRSSEDKGAETNSEDKSSERNMVTVTLSQDTGLESRSSGLIKDNINKDKTCSSCTDGDTIGTSYEAPASQEVPLVATPRAVTADSVSYAKNVQLVLDFGDEVWDSDAAIKALQATNNSPSRAIALLSSDTGLESPSTGLKDMNKQDKRSSSGTSVDPIGTSYEAPPLPVGQVAGPRADIISNADLAVQVGAGAWERDAVIRALFSCNNNLLRAINMLSTDHGDSVKASVSESVETENASNKPSQSSAATPSKNPLAVEPKPKKQKKAEAKDTKDPPAGLPIASVPNEASAALPAIVPPAPESEPKEDKKANKCAKCRKLKQGCPKGCVLARFFTLENASEYNRACRVFSVKNMETFLGQAKTGEEQAHVLRSINFEASAWENDPIRGPLGVLEKLREELADLELKLALATEQNRQLQQQQQQRHQDELLLTKIEFCRTQNPLGTYSRSYSHAICCVF